MRAGHLRELPDRHAAERADRRPPRAVRGMGRPRDRVFALPPSRLALDPTDVVQLVHDGRLTSTAAHPHRRRAMPAGSRRGGTTPAIFDAAAGSRPRSRARPGRGLGPPASRSSTCRSSRESSRRRQPLRRRLRRAVAGPGRGLAQRRRGRLRARHHARRPARIGALAFDLYRRARRRAFDLGNEAVVDLPSGTLASVTDQALFAGANALAVESAPGRLGGAAVRRRRADRARPLPAHPAAARPARHRGRDRQSDAGRRAGGGARRGAHAAVDRRGRARPAGELAHRPGAAAAERRDLRRGELHARRRRPAAVLGRPCRAALAHGARARRSGDPLDPPLARARRRQLGLAEVPLAEESEAYEVEILDGADRRPDARTAPRPASPTRPRSRSRTSARCSVRATRSISASSSSPRSSGGARRASVTLRVLKIPCPTPAPTCCCRICSRRRRRSTSPSTRRCGCSTASCSSPCSTGT